MKNTPATFAALLTLLAVALPARAFDAGDDENVPDIMDLGGTSIDPAQYTIGVVPDYERDLTGYLVLVGETTSYNLLTIQDGGKLLDAYATIGDAAGSDHNGATVTGANSSWSSSGDFAVGGNGSNNSLLISDGGTVSNDYGFIGGGDPTLSALLGNNNSATVTGNGSTWTNAGELVVGGAGSGNSLAIADGGAVTSTFGTIGYGDSSDAAFGSNNTVTVADFGSSWSNSEELFLGSYGSSNSLTVSAGASVSADGVTIGDGDTTLATLGNNNALTVTGAGSSLTGDSHLYLGRYGSSNSLTISAGGYVGADATIIGSGHLSDSTLGNNNHVTVTGPDSTWAPGFFTLGQLGSGNTLDITDGGLVITSASIIGDGDIATAAFGSNNVATIGGSASVWQAGVFYIGNFGSGNSATISDGATVTSVVTVLGNGIGNADNPLLANTNSLTVTGADSSLSSANDLVVGYYGSGNSFTVSAGGHATSESSLIGSGTAEDSPDDTAFGNDNTATITGSGSLWENNTSLAVGVWGSRNTLTVSAGGEVRTAYTTIGVGDTEETALGASNSATITGVGSRLATSADLIVGGTGSGNSLTISAGGTATVGGATTIGAGDATLDATYAQDNHALVTGSGSSFILDGDLAIGANFASGSTLTIEDRALVSLTLATSVVSFGSDTTAGANALQLKGGYFAWAGDHVTDLSTFVNDSRLYYYSAGAFTLATAADLMNGNLTATYYSTGAAASAATGGLYNFTTATTLLTSVPEPSTYGLGLAVVLGGAILLRRRALV